MSVPAEQTTFDGATNDNDKLGKVWEMLQVDTEAVAS